LGKAVRGPDRSVRYFHRGPSQPPNSQKLDLTRALWKFMADRVSHQVEVLLDEDSRFDEVAAYVDIGGAQTIDRSFDEYLKDWPG